MHATASSTNSLSNVGRVQKESGVDGNQNKAMKVKTCLCFSNPITCPCHPVHQEDSVESTYRNVTEDEEDDEIHCNHDGDDQDFTMQAVTTEDGDVSVNNSDSL